MYDENAVCTQDFPAKSLSVGRAMSANDCSAKGGCHWERCLSDGNCLSKPENIVTDIECKLQYCELVAIPGVSHIPQFYEEGVEIMPPSAPFVGSGCRTLNTSITRANIAQAVVSLKSPFKFLIVTKDFCELFDYTRIDSEICGRDVKTLFGPRTDISAIFAGMQSAAMINEACHSVALYNRDGDVVQVDMKFSAYLSDSDTLAGCLLDFRRSASTSLAS